MTDPAATGPVRERAESPSVEEFRDDHLEPSRALVVRDAGAAWPLVQEGAAALLAAAGGAPVPVYDDLFRLRRVEPLDDFLARPDRPGYVRWYSRFRAGNERFPWGDTWFEAVADRWSRPDFLPTADYVLPTMAGRTDLSPTTDRFPGRGLFLSHGGGSTRSHVDPWASDAVICQLVGTKELVLHDDGPGGGTRALLEPGDVAYIPAGCSHRATTPGFSASVTWNFVHVVNGRRFEVWLRDASRSDAAVVSYFLQEDPGGR